MITMNISIRDVSSQIFQKFKEEVAKERIKTGYAISEALSEWLNKKSKEEKKKKKVSLLDVKPIKLKKGPYNISERVDEFVYG